MTKMGLPWHSSGLKRWFDLKRLNRGEPRWKSAAERSVDLVDDTISIEGEQTNEIEQLICFRTLLFLFSLSGLSSP